VKTLALSGDSISLYPWSVCLLETLNRASYVVAILDSLIRFWANCS